MVLTFSVILLGALIFLRPLQKNNFYILHAALVILSAYYVETHYFKTTAFDIRTFMLFLPFHLISINLVTMIAYYSDKKAAIRGAWRIPEVQLHTLEFLGGWPGAIWAQKLFHHKTKKQSFRATFYWVIFCEIAIIIFVIKYIRTML